MASSAVTAKNALDSVSHGSGIGRAHHAALRPRHEMPGHVVLSCRSDHRQTTCERLEYRDAEPFADRGEYERTSRLQEGVQLLLTRHVVAELDQVRDAQRL